ncbi:MAG: beta-N-acetylhexosaminidase, partial [Lachnospiraceae bacterium]|nr:beta-N-acetylhexosaminidase [Lachnospiraceae bacterium]
GTKAALEQYPVGGILYSDKNITSEEQFKTMLSNTRQYSKYPVFLMVSEEPGSGFVGKKLGFTATKNAKEIGATMDPYVSFTENTVIAEYLKNLGIDFNLGIVADVLSGENTDGNIMNGHSFGTDPIIVSRMVFEGVNAHKLLGMNSSIGYFPGQGSLTVDPSVQVTVTQATLDETISMYQEMYTTAVEGGASAIIVSHEYADSLSSDNLPASLSKDIYTSILREKFALYDVILITDCLDKGTICEYYTSEEACVKAIKAGADMLMCPENFEKGYKAVVEAVSGNVIAEARINDALKRVYKVKYRSEFDSLLDAGEISTAINGEEGE